MKISYKTKTRTMLFNKSQVKNLIFKIVQIRFVTAVGKKISESVRFTQKIHNHHFYSQIIFEVSPQVDRKTC